MTACVNKNHGRRVAGVVTASLVGALTLGGVSLAAVPTVAVAEEGASAQVVAPTGDLANSTNIVYTIDTAASGSATNDANNVPTFAAGTTGEVKLTQLTTAGGKTINDFKDFSVRVYKAGADGKPAEGTNPLSGNKVPGAGSYVIEVKGLSGSGYADNDVLYVRFNVKGDSLAGAAAFEVNPNNADDVADTSFYYNGSAIKFGFQKSGNALTEGVDYTVKFLDASGNEATPTNAGTYSAELTGTGAYAGTSARVDGITVQKFNLAYATGNFAGVDGAIVVDDFTDAEGTPAHPSSVWFKGSAGYTTELSADVVAKLGLTFGNVGGNGSYTATVTVPKDLAANFTGTGSTTVYKVANKLTFKWGGEELKDSYTVDATKGGFDLDAVKATYGKQSVSLSSGDFTLVSGPTSGTLSTLEDGSVAGTYKVLVKAQDTSKYEYAGSKTFTVRVTKGSLNADTSVAVTYNPTKKLVTSVEKAYDGGVIKKSDFKVTAKDSDGNDVSKDISYKLVDADGNKVDEAKDAGSYKLVITSDVYDLTGTTEVPVTISKVDLTTLSVGALEQWNSAAGAGEWYLPLTQVKYDSNGDGKIDDSDGYRYVTYVTSVTDPAKEKGLNPSYNTGNTAADPDEANDLKGIDVIPGSVVDYKIEYLDGSDWKQVGSISDKEGQYRLTASVADDVAANYVLPEGKNSVTVEFNAKYSKKFSDVQPSAWYYEWVTKAANQQFMSGDAGASTFRPEASLTRAEAVRVLMNMSGYKVNENDNSYNKEDGTWNTGFDDVDGHHWAASAITWAKRAGVVKGYDGTNDFRPDQTVTRQEFAQMLYNYAKVVAQDSTTANVDTSVLKFSDGVDGWAQTAVAWAVSTPSKADKDSFVINGYPADNTFRGGNNVLRAEVAKMAVSYQTAKL